MKFPHCCERFHRGENGFLRGDYVASWVCGLVFSWIVVGFLGQNGPAGPEPCRSFLQNRPDFLVSGRGGAVRRCGQILYLVMMASSACVALCQGKKRCLVNLV